MNKRRLWIIGLIASVLLFFGSQIADAYWITKVKNWLLVDCQIENTPIGGVTPNTGEFSTLSASSGQISGVIYGTRLCSVVETDTNLTLTSALHSGKIITNDGATASITLTLPAAAAGLLVDVVHTDTDNVQVVAASGESILGSTNNSYVFSAGTAGGVISLVGVTNTDTPVWVRVSSEGTWTDTTVLP